MSNEDAPPPNERASKAAHIHAVLKLWTARWRQMKVQHEQVRADRVRGPGSPGASYSPGTRQNRRRRLERRTRGGG